MNGYFVISLWDYDRLMRLNKLLTAISSARSEGERQSAVDKLQQMADSVDPGERFAEPLKHSLQRALAGQNSYFRING
jgi:hypothetical protein